METAKVLGQHVEGLLVLGAYSLSGGHVLLEHHAVEVRDDAGVLEPFLRGLEVRLGLFVERHGELFLRKRPLELLFRYELFFVEPLVGGMGVGGDAQVRPRLFQHGPEVGGSLRETLGVVYQGERLAPGDRVVGQGERLGHRPAYFGVYPGFPGRPEGRRGSHQGRYLPSRHLLRRVPYLAFLSPEQKEIGDGDGRRARERVEDFFRGHVFHRTGFPHMSSSLSLAIL